MARTAPPPKKVNPFLIWLVANLYKLYSFTWRKKIVYSPEFEEYLKSCQPVLISYWHEDILTNLHIARVRSMMTMSSDSKDAQFVFQIISHFGSTASRGSANKNSVKALKGFIRIMRTGKYWAAISVDGPQGPRYKAKPGITEMSKIFNCPIFCETAVVSRHWTLSKTWDQTKIPKPFSKVTYYFGPGLPAVERSGDAKSPQLLASLEEAMKKNAQRAREIF